jgi:hypothetical protein
VGEKNERKKDRKKKKERKKKRKKKRKKERKKERKKHKPENCVHLGIFGTPPSFSKRIIEATVADNVKLSSDSD